MRQWLKLWRNRCTDSRLLTRGRETLGAWVQLSCSAADSKGELPRSVADLVAGAENVVALLASGILEPGTEPDSVHLREWSTDQQSDEEIERRSRASLVANYVRWKGLRDGSVTDSVTDRKEKEKEKEIENENIPSGCATQASRTRTRPPQKEGRALKREPRPKPDYSNDPKVLRALETWNALSETSESRIPPASAADLLACGWGAISKINSARDAHPDLETWRKTGIAYAEGFEGYRCDLSIALVVRNGWLIGAVSQAENWVRNGGNGTRLMNGTVRSRVLPAGTIDEEAAALEKLKGNR